MLAIGARWLSESALPGWVTTIAAESGLDDSALSSSFRQGQARSMVRSDWCRWWRFAPAVPAKVNVPAASNQRATGLVARCSALMKVACYRGWCRWGRSARQRRPAGDGSKCC